MPEIFINGQSVRVERDQTVMQAAQANGFYIPYFCWHPELSVAGNCRICCVQVEGRSWVEIACNMPVTEGLRVLTDSDAVKAYRKSIMQLMTLNHPVDCGICDERRVHAAGLPLQVQRRRRPRATRSALDKFHALSERIVLDNERCILCSRCVRFTRRSRSRTRSTSRSVATAPRTRRRGSLARRGPVLGQHRRSLPGQRAAVARIPLQVPGLVPRAHTFRLPGCARLHGRHLASQGRVEVERTRSAAERQDRARHPRESGSQRTLICNKGRDLAQISSAARDAAVQKGKPVDLSTAIEAAGGDRGSEAPGRAGVELGINEELAAFKRAAGALRRVRQSGLAAAAGRAARRRSPDPGGQEPEQRAADALFRKGTTVPRIGGGYRPRSGLG
jgi:NADH-quinone oxidoreductase subunit G